MIVATHKIAGVIFRTESDAWLPRVQRYPFKQFRVHGVNPDVCLRIHIDPNTLTIPLLTREEQESLFQNVRCTPGGERSPLLRSLAVRTKLDSCLNRPGRVDVRLDWDQIIIRDFNRCEIDIFCMPKINMYRAELHIASNYPRLFSTFFPVFSAFLVHGAGVIRSGRAAVFLAADEGGKTTVVRLSSGATILHDDQTVLRKEDNIIVVHATPFGKNTDGPYRSPLGGFFLLEKAHHFELAPLSQTDLVQYLWAGNQGYTSFLPKDLKKRAFNIIYDACHQAPVYRMRFPKDYVDWDAIDAAMQTGV